MLRHVFFHQPWRDERSKHQLSPASVKITRMTGQSRRIGNSNGGKQKKKDVSDLLFKSPFKNLYYLCFNLCQTISALLLLLITPQMTLLWSPFLCFPTPSSPFLYIMASAPLFFFSLVITCWKLLLSFEYINSQLRSICATSPWCALIT